MTEEYEIWDPLVSVTIKIHLILVSAIYSKSTAQRKTGAKILHSYKTYTDTTENKSKTLITEDSFVHK